MAEPLLVFKHEVEPLDSLGIQRGLVHAKSGDVGPPHRVVATLENRIRPILELIQYTYPVHIVQCVNPRWRAQVEDHPVDQRFRRELDMPEGGLILGLLCFPFRPYLY